MIKYYIKQAYLQFKQNKLLCGVYILGTGLSIAVVMVLAIVYYIKIAPVYSESNRNRMLYVNFAHEENQTEGYYASSPLSYHALKEYFYKLRTPETVAASLGNEESTVQIPGNETLHRATLKMTDVSFWTVFPFHFIDGDHFSKGDFESGVHSAVISGSLAKKLFGTTKAVGKRILINFIEYRVCGVVEDASRVASSSFSDIWVPFPFSIDSPFQSGGGETRMLGAFKVFILARKASDFEAICTEVREIERKVSALHPKLKFDFCGQPDTHLVCVARAFDPVGYDVSRMYYIMGIIIFILLLIPAVNLMSITSSRMEKRIAELGIRKAFGAGKGLLIREILAENFILTVVGGIAGLLISFLLIELSRNWIFDLGAAYLESLPEGAEVGISFGMLFNPIVFCMALLVCFVINILSALIPAWRFSRRNVVDSLNCNK